jgi:hypothetical protein
VKVGDCVHFTGLQHNVCEAGVKYDEMRDVSAPGIAHWPCMPSFHKRPCKSCPKFRVMTQSEFDKEEAELTRICTEAFLGNCPDCAQKMERKDFTGGYVLVCPKHGERLRECTPKEYP